MSDSLSGGYYQAGPPATVFSVDDANTLQEELVAVATMKGAALDTTGANLHQVRDAIEPAVRAVEGRDGDAANVTTAWLHVVIASQDCDVGDGEDFCAVIASTDSDALGSRSAVIACETAPVTGDNAAAIACSLESGDVGVNGSGSAMLAVSGDGGGAELAGSGCAAVASFLPFGAGGAANAALVGTDSCVLDAAAAASAIVGGTDNVMNGPQSVIAGGSANTVSGSQSAVVACQAMTVSGDKSAAIASEKTAVNGDVSGDNAAAIAAFDSGVSGNQAAVIAGSYNTVDKQSAAVIGSNNSQIPSGANNGVVVLASRYCDAGKTSHVAPAYSVCGGFDAGTTLVQRSWAIESNGGTVRGTAAFTTSGLDYAEMFQNGDGVAHPSRRILTRRGKTARLAQPGDRILGITSAHPTIVGGDDSLGWSGRYLRDESGAVVMHEVEDVSHAVHPDDRADHRARSRELQGVLAAARTEHRAATQRERAARKDGDAEALAAAEAETLAARAKVDAAKASAASLTPPAPRETRTTIRTAKPNPAYDHAREHTPRSRRPNEWTCVGLLGQLPLDVDASVQVDGFIAAGVDGVGTASERETRIECMEIVVPFDQAKGYAVALCLLR